MKGFYSLDARHSPAADPAGVLQRTFFRPAVREAGRRPNARAALVLPAREAARSGRGFGGARVAAGRTAQARRTEGGG